MVIVSTPIVNEFVCQPYSVLGTGSNSATAAYAECAVPLIADYEYTISVCDSFSGDTLLRLVAGSGRQRGCIQRRWLQ
jgi:hypothetical protein